MDVISYLFRLSSCFNDTLPAAAANLSARQLMAQGFREASVHVGNRTYVRCTRAMCEHIPMETRCTIKCCLDYCCITRTAAGLPGGGVGGQLGMTVLEIVGLTMGVLILLGLLVSILALVTRRLVFTCPPRGLYGRFAEDTHVLVVDEATPTAAGDDIAAYIPFGEEDDSSDSEEDSVQV